MSKSLLNRTLRLCLSATWILILSTWPAPTNAQVPNDQSTDLTSAQDFLRATYPELFGRNLVLSVRVIHGMDAPWKQIGQMRFEVTLYDPRSEKILNPPFDPKTAKQITRPENTILLQGNIWFNGSGRLHQFSVGRSALAHSRENEAIHKLVESHPEWSETQAFAELKRAGARFGPENKEELLKAIQLEKYKRFLGNFSIKSAEFRGLAEPREGNFASLSWWIKLDVESPRGNDSDYTFVFEPFEGKLTEVLHGLTAAPEESALTRSFLYCAASQVL